MKDEKLAKRNYMVDKIKVLLMMKEMRVREREMLEVR